MKKVKTTSYKALSLIFTILSTASYSAAAPLLMGGSIQYSKKSTAIDLDVNYSGAQITTTFHKTAIPKVTFEVPKAATQSHFEFLITPSKIEYQLKQLPSQADIQNTIDYIKIDPQSPYKYYEIDLIDDIWEIKEAKLPANGQIPDRAIIIACYPEWIVDFKGGSAVEFPTLYLNNTPSEFDSADEQLAEALIKLELTALDSKIIHAPIKRQVQAASDKKRILIMDMIT